MESFELYFPPATVNPVNGQFRPGHRPFNKGVPMSKWMDGRKIKRVKKYLEIGRKQGNHDLAGFNKIPIVGIKDGKITAFSSATDAAKILKAQCVKVSCRNICAVCHGREYIATSGSKQYRCIRRKAGGYQWYFADQVEKYKEFVK
jgi:hypothetical protein